MIFIQTLIVSLFLLAPFTVSSAAVANDMDSPTIDTAMVQLDGRNLFQVRGMAGHSAQERAKVISGRIKKIASDRNQQAESIVTENSEGFTAMMMGTTLIANIYDADAVIEGLPRQLLADRARINIIQAIEIFRNDRSSKVLFRRTVLAAVATLLLFFALMAIGRMYRSALTVGERYVKTRVDALQARSSNVIESRPLWMLFVGTLKALKLLLTVVSIYIYLNLVLGLYPWTRPVAARLFMIFIDPLRNLGGKFIDVLPDLAFLIVLTVVVRYLLKVTWLFFAGIDRGTLVFEDFDQDWALPTYRIARILIICFALVVAYPYIPGSNTDAFKGVSLFVGVLFSLGSTSLIANLIASLALTYRRAFKVGDIIKVGDVMGLVSEMRLQAVHMRNLYNEAIVIPNSVVVNSNVTNFSALSKKEGLVLHTEVGIGYEVPWRQVETMLQEAATRTSGLSTEKKPFIRQLKLDTFCIQYELGVYCNAPLTMPWVSSNLHRNILDVFNENGVQIMTPAYEGDPETPKLVPKDKFNA